MSISYSQVQQSILKLQIRIFLSTFVVCIDLCADHVISTGHTNQNKQQMLEKVLRFVVSELVAESYEQEMDIYR